MDTPAPNNRIDARSNMFVMAALYAGGGSAPVRIRNMSRIGALVEGALLPPAGAQVRLSRGSISVTGAIVWVEKQKAGVQFDSPTTPSEWVPGGKRVAAQQMADELAHHTRLGAAVRSPVSSTPAQPAQLSEELLGLQQMLTRAAEELASNDGLAGSHLLALQEIDVAAQRLAKLASELDAGRPARSRASP